MSGKKKDQVPESSIKLTLDDLPLAADEPVLSATEANKKAPFSAKVSESPNENTLGFSLMDALDEADRTFAGSEPKAAPSSLEKTSALGLDLNESSAGNFAKEPSYEGPMDLSENSVATVVGALPEMDNVIAQIKAETSKSKNKDHPLDDLPVSNPNSQNLEDDGGRTVVGKITGTLSGIPNPFSKSTPKEFDSFDITKLHSTDKDFETLKKYAALKEREAREKEAIAEVLRKQIIQIKNKLDMSDQERRRVQIEYDELRATVNSLKDAKDQFDQRVRKVESQYQDQIKNLQVQIDSHQFSTQRAERKLSEFRDRVRSDLMKIRARERELSNKLELQKRDAEVLLQAKDERLLTQRREIDRLEFEMQSLKERMIDETSKAEERAAKLTRALQSLRMAQGMLSGIDEEVLPGVGSSSSGKKGDAA